MKFLGPVQFELLHDDTKEAVARGQQLMDYGRILLARAEANINPGIGYNAITNTLPDGSTVSALVLGPAGDGATRQYKVTIRTKGPRPKKIDKPKPFMWIGVAIDWEKTTHPEFVHPFDINVEVYEPEFDGYVTCWPFIEAYPPFIIEPDTWWDQTYNGNPGVGIFQGTSELAVSVDPTLFDSSNNDNPRSWFYTGLSFTDRSRPCLAYSKRFMYLNPFVSWPIVFSQDEALEKRLEDNLSFAPYDPQGVKPGIQLHTNEPTEDGWFCTVFFDPYQGQDIEPFDNRGPFKHRSPHIWDDDWNNQDVIAVTDYGDESRIPQGDHVVKISWYADPCIMDWLDAQPKVALRIDVILNKKPHTIRKTFEAELNWPPAYTPRFGMGWGVTLKDGGNTFSCPWESGLTPNGPQWWQDALLINVRNGTAALASEGGSGDPLEIPTIDEERNVYYSNLVCAYGRFLFSIQAIPPHASGDENLGTLSEKLAQVAYAMRSTYYGFIDDQTQERLSPIGNTPEEEIAVIKESLEFHNTGPRTTYGWWFFDPFVNEVSASMWLPSEANVVYAAAPVLSWPYYIDDAPDQVFEAMKTFMGVSDGTQPQLTALFYSHGQSGWDPSFGPQWETRVSDEPDCAEETDF
jgi:hypothetical protein